MSDPGGNDAVLHGAWKELMEHWHRSSHVWKDAARDAFEKEYLHDLTEAVRSASNAVCQIESFLRQVRKECT